MFKASDVLADGYQAGDLGSLRQSITNNYIVDESAYLEELLAMLPQDAEYINRITRTATDLVNKVRKQAKGGDGVEALLQQYSLDTNEGIILMCLAEALLRIPDADTANALIQDKLNGADWASHLSSSDSMLVNASTWGLLLTGKVINLDKKTDGSPANMLNRLVKKMGEPMVRSGINTAIKIMSKQFVIGNSISEATKVGDKDRQAGYTHSYDMLGEAAFTMDDAQKYFDAYMRAIEELGQRDYSNPEVLRPTISIKLSALHPRYEEFNKDRVLTEMVDTLLKLVSRAKELNIGVSIDAEEADRLELSLDLFEKVFRNEKLRGWGNLGFVVQAYSKRCLPVLMWLNQLAKETQTLIPIRLVKGAYWDFEVKLCQQMGIEGYPVFTRKPSSDVSYLACAKYLLSDATRGNIFPQFATHNAQTVANIMDMAGDRDYEFQRLHGMGKELYDVVLEENKKINVRIYAPVGAHKDLLPYLVRRLLENGANSSFVHKLVDPRTPVDTLVKHPIQSLREYATLANDKIPLPTDIFSDRKNSEGTNLHIESQKNPFMKALDGYQGKTWQGGSIVNGKTLTQGDARKVTSPQKASKQIGDIYWADESAISSALDSATTAFNSWVKTPVETRAQALEKLADLLESNKSELIALCTLEAGKSVQDGIDEVREAVDFCRYYANQARKLQGEPELMPGPTGETNELFTLGRGVFVCISPWNFPLAIFLGQVAAALVTGNTVIAKPAEQTCLVAYRAVQLAHQAGIPHDALHLLIGDGATVGAQLTSDVRVAGVCFTGSTQTAQAINRALANRPGAIAPLIAETGGQNAMLVDSSALPEQVVNDVVQSSFTSAGQRCSALRVLYVQDDVADRVLTLIKGAMAELTVGDPMDLKTDVGPVIDTNAKAGLDAHIARMTKEGKLIAQAPMGIATTEGNFVVPTTFEIDSINQLEKEQFGPILHVIRYKANELDKVIDEINSTGYGLTLGIHTRNESRALAIADRVNVGNAYINRNQIGAVVGVQPFGGQGLSGTGPKAGGPQYLNRFVTEKTRTNNITAIGGNASLLLLGEG